jgi:hypothetical protein
VIRRHVDRPAVDADALSDLRRDPEEVAGRTAFGAARKLEPAGWIAPARVTVAIRVAIPEEIQAPARTELDQIEAAAVGYGQERRQETPAALHLVRLYGLLGDEAREPLPVCLEDPAELRPRVLHHPRKLEVVNAAEEAKRRFPLGLVVAHERLDDGLVGERAGERRVELRASLLEVVRHPAEDLWSGFRQRFSPA